MPKFWIIWKNTRARAVLSIVLQEKTVDNVYLMLRKNRIAAARYHAGLDNDTRKESQEDFIYDRAQVIVATNAFGMGIDKSNVRFVLHYNMPACIENYYQEAGSCRT